MDHQQLSFLAAPPDDDWQTLVELGRLIRKPPLGRAASRLGARA